MSTLSRANAIIRAGDRRINLPGERLRDCKMLTQLAKDPIPALDDPTVPKLPGETGQVLNGEDAWSFRDAGKAPFYDVLSAANRGAIRRLAA